MLKRVLLAANWIQTQWGWLKWVLALALVIYLCNQNQDGFHRLASRSLLLTSCGLALALATANVLLTFCRWYLLVRGLGISFRLLDALRIGFLGGIFNLVGAGAAGGDVVRAMLIAKQQDSRRAVAMASVVLDRAIGLITLLIVGAVAACFQTALIERSVELQVLAGMLWTGSTIGVAGLLVLSHPAITRWSLLDRLGKIPWVGESIHELIQGIGMYQQRRTMFAAAIGIGVLAHLCGLSSFYFCAQALQFGAAAPSFPGHLLLIPSAVIVEIVVPLPGGIGALEAAVQQCYVLANAASTTPVPQAQAAEAGFFTALLFRLLTLLIAVIGGVYYLATRREQQELA